jgi:hypothetical protein
MGTWGVSRSHSDIQRFRPLTPVRGSKPLSTIVSCNTALYGLPFSWETEKSGTREHEKTEWGQYVLQTDDLAAPRLILQVPGADRLCKLGCNDTDSDDHTQNGHDNEYPMDVPTPVKLKPTFSPIFAETQ